MYTSLHVPLPDVFHSFCCTDTFLPCFVQDPHPKMFGRGGWSDFHKLLDGARWEYRDFLTELGFSPFLSIPYMYLSHSLVRC